ncbi:hypothetical protein L7F22_049097 [Adiantum nelumboides]|nr:hypothetical protein [Adiantum nelumboides]
MAGHLTGIYLHVVADVISNVREDFMNEGVDEAVLQELQSVTACDLSPGRFTVPLPGYRELCSQLFGLSACVKYDRGKAYGLLQPLLIPTAPWESIAMDFIFGLPKTSSGIEGIWTIVDRFSKQTHFILVRKQITAEQMAKIFLVTVFKYHGMPRSIVSDRDPCMTRLFWRALWQNLHSTLQFSVSYHPQTDGQFEIVNSEVLDLLKCYVSDNSAQWEHYLPLVEFAYNNAIHSSTGKAPFEIVDRARKPPPMVKVMDDVFEADKFVKDLDLAYQQVQHAIHKAQEK